MLIVTLCAAVALLGAADCHVIPPPLETSELLLPPLVEKTGREEETAVVGGGEEHDGQTERETEAVGADILVVEEEEGGEVADGGREWLNEEEDWERAEEMVRDSCPSGWRLYGRRCFRYESTSRTWAEAERYCLNNGANLASVHSLGEHNFLLGMTTSYSWIGGYDATEEGVWFWSDGSRFDYQNWSPGNPNNRRGQHCLATNYDDGLQWDDNWCSSRLPSICARGSEPAVTSNQ